MLLVKYFENISFNSYLHVKCNTFSFQMKMDCALHLSYVMREQNVSLLLAK